MKFIFQWNETQAKNEVELISHPDNKLHLQELTANMKQKKTISVINPKNSRVVIIDVSKIEVIEALGHLTKIITSNSEIYHYQKRLKDLVNLEKLNLFRINQSTILNLTEITSFIVGQHARLEIATKSNHTYIVSRHYAKKIKERLSC